jgi:tRNA threonylcarbamoyladenosine biosynthesis protein TsaE
MDSVFESFTLGQLSQAASKLIKTYPDKRVFAVYGAMGAGKTTFIKSVCKELNVTDIVGSPTFSIINQYQTRDGNPIYHFDFYRMKKPEEAFDIGYEEYLYSGNYCFLEWPEIIENLLPEDCVKVYLEDRNGIRYIKI